MYLTYTYHIPPYITFTYINIQIPITAIYFLYLCSLKSTRYEKRACYY